MATGTTTIALTPNGQYEITSVLGIGGWGVVTVDTGMTVSVLIDDGGTFPRTVDLILTDLVVDPTVSPASTVKATFTATGDARGFPTHNGVHTGETAKLAALLPQGLFTDGVNLSGSVAASTALTGASTIPFPIPMMMWAFPPRQNYDGDLVGEIEAYSRYGVVTVDIDLIANVTISKQVTLRTVVDIGSDSFLTTKSDPYVFTFTAAEMAAAGVVDGLWSLRATATDNAGTTHVSEAAGSIGFKTLRDWPVHIDQAGTFKSSLPVAYIDSTSTVTTGALTGGGPVLKNSWFTAESIVGGLVTPVIGVLMADYAGSGTMSFVIKNVNKDTVGHVLNGATINFHDEGSDAANGITAVASANSVYTYAHNSGVGVLGDPAQPFSSLGWASRAVTLANEAAGRGKHNAGVYYFKSPFTFFGNDDFLSTTLITEAPVWAELRVAPGFTSDDVYAMGPGGQTCGYCKDSGSWIHMAGDWTFRHIAETESNFFSVSVSDKAYIRIDNMSVVKAGAESAGFTSTNIRGLFIDTIKATGLNQALSKGGSMSNTTGWEYGFIIKNYPRMESLVTPVAESGDTFQFNNDYNGLIRNSYVEGMLGSAATHYDTFQSSGVCGNIIVSRFYDRNNRYQHAFFGQGVDGPGVAFICAFLEQTTDGDMGSDGLSFGNTDPEPFSHFVAAHCTYLAEFDIRSVSNSGNLAHNTVIQNSYMTGYDSTLLAALNRLPSAHSSLTNCHVNNENAGLGVRGTGALDALPDLFDSPATNAGVYPTNAQIDGYAPKAAGPLAGRLLAKDNTHGLLIDIFGNPIPWDGTGSIGAIQMAAVAGAPSLIISDGTGALADGQAVTIPDAIEQGAVVSITFLIQNSGTLDATIGTAVASGHFSIAAGDDPSGTTLAIGATIMITLDINTADVGAVNGTLSIPSDDPASPFDLSLSATVTAPAALPGTSGPTTRQAYLSVAETDAILDEVLMSAELLKQAWDSLSPTDKPKATANSTIDFDAIAWDGFKYSASQANAWPRIDRFRTHMILPSGESVVPDAVGATEWTFPSLPLEIRVGLAIQSAYRAAKAMRLVEEPLTPSRSPRDLLHEDVKRRVSVFFAKAVSFI